MRAISCVFAAFLTLVMFSSTVRAQSEPEEDLYSVVDRAHALVEQLQADLDGGASQQQLWSEASTTFALLLTVQDRLRGLDPTQWDKVRALSETLYFQAEAGEWDKARPVASDLLSELTVLREAVSFWEAQGVSVSVIDYGAYPDSKIVIPVEVSNVPDAGIGSVELGLSFSEEVAHVDKVTYPWGKGETQIDNDNGVLLARISDMGLAESGPASEDLLAVTFSVVGKERDVCVITIEHVIVYDMNGNKVPATAANGSLRVLPPEDAVGGGSSEDGGLGVGIIVVLSVIGVLVAGGLILLGSRLIFVRK